MSLLNRLASFMPWLRGREQSAARWPKTAVLRTPHCPVDGALMTHTFDGTTSADVAVCVDHQILATMGWKYMGISAPSSAPQDSPGAAPGPTALSTEEPPTVPTESPGATR